MELIRSYKAKYNIGINAGDDLVNILINKNELLPTNKKISFIIPEIEEEYNIDIVMGDNILAKDNILLSNIKIKCNEKKIFLNIDFNTHFIYIEINTKINNIYKNIINYYDNFINYYEKIIDVDYYKLKFDIIQIIKIIRKKINLNYIILDDESKNILETKFNNLLNNLDSMNNQKMLDIKIQLKTKFFID
jgi:hypothetical protein